MFELPAFVFTPVGTIVVYLGIGVLMVLAGEVADKLIARRPSAD